jgi:alkylation response protein AidB-like acyl-CoA dehydrogenase
MGRLCETDGLNEDQTEILKAVRTFVDEKILPVATELEHADEYPTEIVEGLKELGVFGLMIPEEYDGLGESLLTYALAVEEIARGWMSVSGIINTHFIVAWMLLHHGTQAQKEKYLPRMATGEVRGAFSMSEPGCGSDVAAIKTKAVKGDDGYEITGQKMWLTNGGSANLVAVLVKTDEGADSVYKNMTTFLVEKEEGFGETAQGVTIPGKIDKMGYKGVDTTEMVFEGHRISADQILGGEPGKGFYQMMDGVEVGRVNVATRWWSGPRGSRTRASATTSRPGWPSTSPRSSAPRSSRTPSGSTAATGSRRSTRSSGSTARRRCCSSARARPTSSG